MYPAFFSMASRSASCCSRPLWLQSSSSMMAMTLSCREHRTKSLTLRSKRFRVACDSVVMSAENATWASTMHSGSADVNSKYIFCSCGVSGGLRLMFRIPFFSCFCISMPPIIFSQSFVKDWIIVMIAIIPAAINIRFSMFFSCFIKS